MQGQSTKAVTPVLERAVFAAVVAYLVAAVVLNGIEIGPFTPRAELLALVIGLTLWQRPDVAAVVPETLRRPVVWLAGTFAAFVAWSAAAGLAHGDPVGDVLHRVTSDHAAAFAGFVAIVVWTTTEVRLRWVVLTLVVMLGADALLVVLQELDVDAAWDVWAWLFPLENRATDRGVDLAPGLVHDAFNHAFLLAAIAPLVVVVLDADRRVLRGIVVMAALTGFAVVVRERTGLIVLLVMVVAWVVLIRRYAAGGLRTVPGLQAVVGVAAAGVVVYAGAIAFATASSDDVFERDLSTTRLARFDDTQRRDLLADAWPAIVSEPIVGHPHDAIGESGERLNPTSMFLNAAVFAGIPGLVLAVATTGAFLVLVHRATVVLGGGRLPGWLGRVRLAAMVGVLAHLVASQLHNRSLVEGDYLPWWLAAIAIVSVRLDLDE